MKKLFASAALGASALVLAACNGSDDASSGLDADTVEMPADTALEAVTEEPVEDDAAALEEVAEPAPVSNQTAQQAADAAEEVVSAVEAAEAAEAALAAEAADAAAALDVE